MRGDSLKTLYIDVYFMINFTVDILSIFIALKLAHMNVNLKKLILSGILGAAFAVVELFIRNMIVHIILASVFIFLISYISCKGASFARNVKFIIFFYLSAFFISGAVNFVYSILDRWLKGLFSPQADDNTNKKALVFSLIILLLIGVVRLLIMMLSNSINEKSTRIKLKLEEKTLELDALIDTGNLVKDPMNMNPVIFLKKCYAEKIIPATVIELTNLDSLSTDYRKRIRLIPVTKNSQTHVMTGIRMDKVIITGKGSDEEINATVVIDKEEGTYGGYYALTPYVSVLGND